MKRVAYMLGSLNRGGTEILILDVLKNLSKHDINSICIYRKEGALEDEYSHLDVPLYKLTPGSIRNLFSYLLKLRKLIIEKNIEIVHAQQNIDAFYALVATCFLPVKVIQTFHGYNFSHGFINKWLEKFTVKNVLVNLFVSKVQKDYYEKIHKKHRVNTFKVVYNGISFDKFKTNCTVSIRKELAIDEDVLLIGSVGNFTRARDQIVLCRFANRLKQEGIKFRLLLIGKKDDNCPEFYDNSLKYCFENELNNEVMFLGSRPDVPDILIQLDSFVYSTLQDTFGIAVVEAISVGIPVFVNDLDVMSEITQNGKSAILYKTKDDKNLFDKFLLFLNNKKSYQDNANLASEWVKNQYSIENHIENIKKIYESI